MVEKHGYDFSGAAVGEMRYFDAPTICGTGASPDCTTAFTLTFWCVYCSSELSRDE